MTLAQQIRELMGRPTKGPFDCHTGSLVRSIRGDMAVPLFESRTPHADHPKAPTVRHGGEVIMRANSEGAKISAALRAEHANVDLVALLLNNAETLAQAVDAQEWRMMADAPRDRTHIWAKVGKIEDERWAHLSGRHFEIWHEGKMPSSYDMGWAMFPGFGGAPDHWFIGWLPLPAPPTKEDQINDVSMSDVI